ncbi:MAG: SDR family NAD(P)-dependent oxidoreductase [Proteobacteria bacterium]|nr:SDR family NAD(P)-dependent oxidoreductase [Pseudomonadota bacterium]MBU1710092.1 SDR family NAD(P)-dependent oxidoreductase [Pseudomonadota bacterium]
MTEKKQIELSEKLNSKPSDIAIIGMSCLLPNAADLPQYWDNIIYKVNSLREIPADRWDWREFYNADSGDEHSINSKWGGFIDPQPFDPAEFGMPPNSVQSVEPLQLLTLATAQAALKDAGYLDKTFPRETTSVILGIGSGIADLALQYSFKAHARMFFKDVSGIDQNLPKWTEDSYPGILPNVTAGRIANRLDLGGVNFVVDAACGSSLGAIYQGVKELETGTSDMVITGGAEGSQNPFAYFCFSKTHALSSTGECRVFDQGADGTVLSEGIVIVILKRLDDAVRDHDRIYAVIKSVAGSSDGKDRGLTAPRPEGQHRALERAYAKSGVDPDDIGLIEAHGTGTVVGDRIEIESLSRIFTQKENQPPKHAIGSVKSQIGHSKGAAGAAGLVKAALALYHKVLPPTANVKSPNRALENTSLYVNSQTRPWIHSRDTVGRCASVSAFGFGGTNFHAVLEEFTAAENFKEAPVNRWPEELFVWRGENPAAIQKKLQGYVITLQNAGPPSLLELSCKLWDEARAFSGKTLAIVASSKEDLRNKILKFIRKADEAGTGNPLAINDSLGIFYNDEPLLDTGKVAYLFPGQGAQYPGMLNDLAVHFSEVRIGFEIADRILSGKYDQPLSATIFPPPFFTPGQEEAAKKQLSRTHTTQPAVGAASLGICNLLDSLGIRPELVCGHSYGELSALRQAGAITVEDFFTLSEIRGRLLAEAGKENPGAMAAIDTEEEIVKPMLSEYVELWIANCNSPKQTVVSGNIGEIEAFVEKARAAGFRATRLPVSGAFHTPFLSTVKEAFSAVLQDTDFSTGTVPVYSNTRAEQYPGDPAAMREVLAGQIINPVRFIEEIRAMYEAGARVFIEAGPRNILGTLVTQILADFPHAVITLDNPGEHGVRQLLLGLGSLAAQGVNVNFDRLFAGRIPVGEKDGRATSSVKKKASSTKIMLKLGKTWPSAESRSSVANKAAQSALERIQKNPAMEMFAAGRGAAHIGDGDMDGVIIQYQKSMQRFLDMQREIMLTYLEGAPPEGAAKSQALKQNGAGANIVVPSPEPVPKAPQPLTVGLNAEVLKEKILALVSDRTGYPRDMLDPDADMEADMGIDSIKRVEILGAIQKEHLSQYDEPNARQTQDLAERKTLQGIIDWLIDFISSQQGVAEVSQPVQQKAAGPDVKSRILNIVSDRTGYPLDMLDPAADMEADMGIDSIKRVEILGALQKELLSQYDEPNAGQTQDLGGRKTLQGIVDWVVEFTGAIQPGAGEPVIPQHTKILQPEKLEVPLQAEDLILPRYEVRISEMPFQEDAKEVLPAKGVVVITDDEQGLAREIQGILQNKGLSTVLLRLSEAEESSAENELCCRFDSFEGASKAIGTIRKKYGPISGLIHLAGLREMMPYDKLTLSEWQKRLREDVKSLFYLIKASAADLQVQAETDRAWIAGITNLGGTFTLEDLISESTFNPGHGGIAGMLKALQREWPVATCKAIDFDPVLDQSFVAQQIVRELTSLEWDVEVGFREEKRLVVRVIPTPLMDDPEKPAPLAKDDIVVITGGARGITAEIAIEIAEQYQSTLLLLGRSAPIEPESEDTVDLSDHKEIRAALFKKMQVKDSSVKPADVERVFKQILRTREMSANFRAMEKAGSIVRYFQADACDEPAMTRTLEKIYNEYGRIDAFVHGAGIIEDAFIESKSPESFERVFDTKAESIFILERLLRGETLKLMVLFASVVGRFGNAGQLDYAATNEVMNKVACRLNRRWPGRILSIDWGPWADAGMASPEVQAQLRERGIKLVDPPRGRYMFEREIRLGRKEDVEIVIGGGLWGSKDEEIRLTDQDVLPLLDGDPPGLVGHEVWHYNEIIDLPRHPYLLSHLMASKPVIPVAIIIELMAEIIKYGWNDWIVTGLEDLRIIKGIIIYPGRTGIRITVYPTESQALKAGTRVVEARAFQADNPKFPTHMAKFTLAHQLPDSPRYDPETLGELEAYPLSIEDCYDQLLFHGPKLQHVEEVLGIGENAIRSRMRISDPKEFLDRFVEHGWIIDPVIIDCLSQQINFWTRAKLGSSSFPTNLGSCRLFNASPAEQLFCDTRITRVSSGGSLVVADIRLWNDKHETVMLVENMEFSSSEKLNYLHKEELRSEMILDD